ncbi:MAG: type II toxin-antitoxin system VapC family toxin [Prevotellaceae bacterium]|jgi:PIN domain nuclease of toxin-antitoxin system|nr:type II toxin-antitoxin system VapC family toxin [Prevotellaceae bacterium]
MRYLIDTNILIRLKTDKAGLSKDVLQIIEDPENLIYVSAASVWEIYMLMHGEKIHVPAWKCARDVFDTIKKELGYTVNYIKEEHLLTFAGLAPVKNHTDPFDRMIVAQAITEEMPLISSDTNMKHYRRQTLDFIPNTP